MDRLSLPGIKAIGYIPAERLQREIMYKHLAGIPVGIFTDVTPIAFVGVPTCEAVSTYNNNGRVEQTTLRFQTLDDVPLYAGRRAPLPAHRFRRDRLQQPDVCHRPA